MNAYIGTLFIALLLLPVFWFYPPLPSVIEQEEVKQSSGMSIQWSSYDNEHLRLEGALIDSTPLYLPTIWNFSPTPPEPVHQRLLPPVESAFPSNFLIQTPQTWEQIQPATDPNPQETALKQLLSRWVIPYSKFWKIRRLPSYSLAVLPDQRSLPMEIRQLRQDNPLWTGEITVGIDEAVFPATISRPVEFRVLITPEGATGPVFMESSTGDQALNDLILQKVRSHPYWQNARPGYYQVWVGLL